MRCCCSGPHSACWFRQLAGVSLLASAVGLQLPREYGRITWKQNMNCTGLPRLEPGRFLLKIVVLMPLCIMPVEVLVPSLCWLTVEA